MVCALFRFGNIYFPFMQLTLKLQKVLIFFANSISFAVIFIMSNILTDNRGASIGLEPSSLLQTSSLTSAVDVGGAPSLCIAVIGATGELARRKIFPALF